MMCHWTLGRGGTGKKRLLTRTCDLKLDRIGRSSHLGLLLSFPQMGSMPNELNEKNLIFCKKKVFFSANCNLAKMSGSGPTYDS
jgi:hypothetical protein